MKTMRQLDDAVLEGNASKGFLENPLFTQAVTDARDDVFRRWVQSLPDESELREQLYHRWHALEDTLRGLQRPITEGKLAAKERETRNYQAKLG